MAVQQKKVSRSQKRRRASHSALTPVKSIACPECGAPKLPHRVCLECGTYAGRQVLVSKEGQTPAE